MLCCHWSIAHASYPLDGVIQVTGGFWHTCVLLKGGHVKCWGSNTSGQLGDGTTASRDTPVDVAGLTNNVTAIAAGLGHTCALTNAGSVKCWGHNNDGQLGDGTTTGRLTPVDIVGLASGVAAIAAGDRHTCALTDSGGIKCWGSNNVGQLGNDADAQRLVPADVSGLASGVTSIAAGHDRTCAVTAIGAAKCWGNNAHGQLGDGTTTTRFAPVGVSGLASGVAKIAIGIIHTCALTNAGGVKCWGYNGFGELGDETTIQRLTPVSVSGLGSGVRAIVATCALTSEGAVKCWGYNGVGQVGDGTTAVRPKPVDVSGLTTGVAAIGGGVFHTCALMTDGGVKCWGLNQTGELGDGTLSSRATPVGVSGLASGATTITAGGQHSCALTAGGKATCWGFNAVGELGDGTTEHRSTPIDVAGLGVDAAAIAAGMTPSRNSHTCALTRGGGVKCWGWNSFGQLGDGTTTDRLTPVDVLGLEGGVIAIANSAEHSCALTTGGGVKCWGNNAGGQLGDGTTTKRSTPVDVVGLANGVVAITAGQGHTCALLWEGGVKCWGWNNSGSLGDGTQTPRSRPVDVAYLRNATAISAGYEHTCALLGSGAAVCWGANGYGQLGNGTTTDSPTVLRGGGLAHGVKATSAGGDHTCALLNDGTAWCWGRNNYGQLGDGTTASRLTPVRVSRLGAHATAIAAGYEHSCALTSGGGVKCWGNNFHGQLGNGERGYSPVPVAAGSRCAGFDDVDPESPFCPSLAWLSRRQMTFGCDANLYCPVTPASRLAASAFANRLGSMTTMLPVVVEAGSGLRYLDLAERVCISDPIAIDDIPRRAYVDGIVMATAPASVEMAVSLVASSDYGATWMPLAAPTPAHVPAGHWGNVRVLAHVDPRNGETLQFALRLSRISGTADLSESRCHLRVRLGNRNSTLTQ